MVTRVVGRMLCQCIAPTDRIVFAGTDRRPICLLFVQYFIWLTPCVVFFHGITRIYCTLPVQSRDLKVLQFTEVNADFLIICVIIFPELLIGARYYKSALYQLTYEFLVSVADESVMKNFPTIIGNKSVREINHIYRKATVVGWTH